MNVPMEEKMSTVYLEHRPNSSYPYKEYGPACMYPEYKYGEDTIQEKNDIYDMVRNCLFGLELDLDNYGTAKWNPLGKYIKPGDCVLIKPNWVMHFNGAKHVTENALECLVTHPSCLRAICDYCLIALKGTGLVIIGDAPMQDCDLSFLLDKAHFNNILLFYKAHGQSVTFMDFRKYQTTFDHNKVIIDKIYQSGEATNVDMGSLSMHEKKSGKRIYQVDNYNRDETSNYHGEKRHIYSINKDVLNADVIINFCKPKSHRLAGFTAAMKNMVGIAYNKASLPHRVEGSVEEGGDAYLNKSRIKQRIDHILDRKLKHEDEHNIFLATIDRYIYGALLLLERKFGKDPYIKGIWYGNDTIWRTVMDLNYIERYADKNGILQKKPQRKILNFADMVIAGHHNGPCQPEPKEMGIIMAGEDAVAMDLAICKIIGYPDEKIPMVRSIRNHEADYLFGHDYENINIVSNCMEYVGDLEGLQFPVQWRYQPHDSWAESLK